MGGTFNQLESGDMGTEWDEQQVLLPQGGERNDAAVSLVLLPCEESDFVHGSLPIRRQLDDRSGEEKNRGRACVSPRGGDAWLLEWEVYIGLVIHSID